MTIKRNVIFMHLMFCKLMHAIKLDQGNIIY